jgi:hypothetical protein
MIHRRPKSLKRRSLPRNPIRSNPFLALLYAQSGNLSSHQITFGAYLFSRELTSSIYFQFPSPPTRLPNLGMFPLLCSCNPVQGSQKKSKFASELVSVGKLVCVAVDSAAMHFAVYLLSASSFLHFPIPPEDPQARLTLLTIAITNFEPRILV